MSDDRQCPDCGHIIAGDELAKRKYYGYFNQQDDDYMRCTKCQRAADADRARNAEHLRQQHTGAEREDTKDMTKFGCTTCWKTGDDKEIKFWDDKPVCARCYDKYERHV